MDDKSIIRLFWERSEKAISETHQKYGKYLYKISYGILSSHEDCEECLNDTYHRAWNNIPPTNPPKLSTYLAKIVRRLALDKLDYKNAAKRSTNAKLIFEEAEEFLPDPAYDFDIADEIALKNAINKFLGGLSQKTRIIFIKRYFHFYGIKDISEQMNVSESNVKTTLLRTRRLFKEFLEKEGFII
ncbi:MAG: sigma-70 family RNA polymerase sigma factor [Ruminococcaceae bacterium]|nr:sigma-70 family RNA polymerase sigma factor [Oscillospiraceae bacterium]